ncbi:MAG: type II toxin-antitoxin system RelE/ParE family toxin [Planctomycetales bacterium]|nr:type II toxin-antitoxin system RelE/ParE family toxin [Planctomycetales bacterium]
MPNVSFTERAAVDLAALPKPIKARIAEMISRLAKWPDVSGAKALTGDLTGSYRLRTGDYRLQFHVERDAVVIDRVGHRDGFYEE